MAERVGLNHAVERRSVRRWSAALVLLCIFSAWLQFRHIARTVPYPLETDETAVSGSAARIVQTGMLNPSTFIYPSLPAYLAAVGMAGGFVRSAARLEASDIRRVGNIGYPYYGTPGVLAGARQVFALLAVVALAATGVAAWHAFRAPPVIFLAPLVLWATPLFFHDAWAYLNVDIISTAFAALALAACLKGTREPSLLQSAVVPGTFVGFAVGSKYTLVALILSVLAAIVIWNGSKRVSAAFVAVTAMVVAFLIVVPYSVLALNAFLYWVAWDAMHYAGGHIGADADPGWPQILFYGRHLLSEFAIPGSLIGLVGAVSYARMDWRRLTALAAFPLGLLWLLASARVHFPRNVLALQPVIALFVGYGIVVVYRQVAGFMAPRLKQRRLASGAIAALLLLIAVPPQHVRDNIRDHADSRNLATAWIEQTVPVQWTVAVDPEMAFDTRPLEARGQKILSIKLRAAVDVATLDRVLSEVPQPAVVLVPYWGADARFEGQAAADVLNAVASRLRVVKTFGSNPVLVNYPPPTAWGDPRFSAAVLGDERLVTR